MRYTTLLCIVPPYCGCGWHTSAASTRLPCSGSSSSASNLPAGPAMVIDSIRRGMARLHSAVVRELHVDAEIALPQSLNHFLKRVAILAAHAHEIALDGRLDLL